MSNVGLVLGLIAVGVVDGVLIAALAAQLLLRPFRGTSRPRPAVASPPSAVSVRWSIGASDATAGRGREAPRNGRRRSCAARTAISTPSTTPTAIRPSTRPTLDTLLLRQQVRP